MFGSLRKSVPFIFLLTVGLFSAAIKAEEFSTREILAGGWAIHEKVDAEAASQLAQAVALLKNQTEYRPVAYATQVVAGLNYSFVCIALPQKGVPYFCKISFYKNLQQEILDVEEKKIPFKE